MRCANILDDSEFGTEDFGTLKSAILHRPNEAIKLITNDNKDFFLFNEVPEADKYLEEQMKYEELLRSQGIKVHNLKDFVFRNTDLINVLPDLTYLHDIAVVSSKGAILSKMASRGRCHEEIVVKEALLNLGVPILYEPQEGEDFEGCLFISKSSLFIADTERHGRRAIEKFIDNILKYFDEIIYAIIPQERRYMHSDMIFNRVTDNLMVYYPPAFIKTFHITKNSRQEINIKEFMNKRNIEMFGISDTEQKNWGCSFVPLKPGVVINYDISLEQKTLNILESEGVRFIHFHPDALLAGGGSLRCLTLRLFRES